MCGEQWNNGNQKQEKTNGNHMQITEKIIGSEKRAFKTYLCENSVESEQKKKL